MRRETYAFVPTRFVAVVGVIWMFASTNVFTASPEFGDWPSVCTMNAAEPPTDNSDDACPGHLPRRIRGEHNRALTAGVRVRTSTSTGPGRGPNEPPRSSPSTVKSTCSPAAATKPATVTEVLLQRHRERMRRPHLVRRVRSDRDPRIHERLHRITTSRRRRRRLDRERRRPPTESVEDACPVTLPAESG